MPKKGTSIYPGVHWCNNRKAWIAYGWHQKKCVYLGQYTTEDAAGAARKEFQENPIDRKVPKIDVNNMQTCKAFTRSEADY